MAIISKSDYNKVTRFVKFQQATIACAIYYFKTMEFQLIIVNKYRRHRV